MSETAEMWQVVHHLYGLTNDPPHMDQNLRTKRPIQGHMQPDDVPIVWWYIGYIAKPVLPNDNPFPGFVPGTIRDGIYASLMIQRWNITVEHGTQKW